MSAEQNKATVLRGFEEIINQRRFDLIDEVIDSSYVNHDMPTPAPGAEGFRQVIGTFLDAFPDMKVTIEDAVAEGNLVATRGRMTGTHKGEFMGVPASGRPVDIVYIDEWRVENGKAVENWVRLDVLGLMQQIGAAPA